MGCVTTYRYDQASNRTKETDPEGIAVTYSYDALNRPATTADALGHTNTYHYDPCGDMTDISMIPKGEAWGRFSCFPTS